MNKVWNILFKKITGVFCALILIITAVYVPVVMSASAAAPMEVKEGEAVLFDFTENIGKYNSKENVNEFEANGLGILGWANSFTAAQDNPENTVLANIGTTKTQNYPTFGAVRLHKKVESGYEVYNLEPNTQYVVSLKVRVISSSDFTDAANTAHECYLSMGYGTYKTGTDTNYLSNMQKTLVKVVSTKAGSDVYTLATDLKNKKQVDCGAEWQNVIYTFTTPADLGEKDHALAFYATTRTNFRAELDDVAVTKLGETTGAVLLVDDYSSKTEVMFGKVGEAVALPDISNRATDSKHKFLGWFTDDTYSEKVEFFKLTSGISYVYSNWSKPVKVIFKDTYNNTSTVAEGMAGEELTFPDHPFDPKNKAWFLGWYTDESYSVEYTDGKFGFADTTLFSRWQTEYLELTQDFENYEKDDWEVKDRTSGSVTYKDKSNSYYFAQCFTKEQVDGDYAIKLNWNPTMEKDISKADGVNVNSPESYDAATRYNSNINIMVLGEHLENFHEYKMSFKYKVVKAETDISFYAATAVRYNIYGSTVYSENHHLELKESEEWQEFSFNFNTNFAAENGKGIFLGFVLDENAEVVMYIDDVKVESLTSPAEALVTLVKNNGEENQSIIALKGKELKLPTVKHSDNANFLGWYTDSAFTKPFDQEICPATNVILYAKWSNVPISFKTYPFDTANNGKLVHIENSKDIGLNDDYAAHWKFDGSAIYRPAADSSTNEDVLWATRGNQNDHILKIAEKLENGAVYKITFNYKVSNNTNVATTITPLSGHRSNIYLTACVNAYTMNTISIPEGGVKWSKAEYYISANVKSSGVYVGDSLYLSFKTAKNDAKNKADIFIDNLYVEKVEAPYVFFDCQNNENLIMVDGAKGDKITVPQTPQKFSHSFTGWYTDIECTKKFDKEAFEGDEEITVYAGWKKASTATTSFENYKLSTLGDCIIDKSNVASGKYSAHYTNRTEGNYRAMSYVIVGDGNVPFEVEVGKKYVATFKYRINKKGTSDLSLDFVSGSLSNFWVSHTNNLILSDTEKISKGNQEILEGKWLTMSLVIDTKVLKETDKSMYTVLYLRLRGIEEGDISIDDITVTELSKGKSVVLIDNGGSSSVPSYLVGNNKVNFYNKLPKNPTVKDKHFIGYYIQDSAGKLAKLEPEKAVFAAVNEKPVKVYAKFVDTKITESFDDGEYVDNLAKSGTVYTAMDFDYEVYDSEKEGNSKNNVTSGRYSLHKKGKTEFFENAVLLTFKNQLAEGQRYTVTFKVKMGEHLHTDGAIKIVSGKSFEYSWSTMGDYYPVIPISELTDGNWHEVSYTFNAIEAFAVIQVPGYVELFMDDFEFALVDKTTPLSTPVTFTEYVPVLRNADGSIANPDIGAIDVTTIIDDSVYNNGFNLMWVIIPVSFIAVAVIVIFIVLKKKNRSKV